MFDTLVASHVARLAWRRSAAMALLLHAGVIAAAVAVRPGENKVNRQAELDTVRLDLMVPQRSDRPARAAPVPDRIAPAGPSIPPIDLKPIGPPLRLDLPPTPISPQTLAGLDHSGHSEDAVAPTGGPWSSDSVFSTVDVDRLPELAEEIHPDYPEALRATGLSGTVELDT